MSSLTKICPQGVQANPESERENRAPQRCSEHLLSDFLHFLKHQHILGCTLTLHFPSRKTELLFFPQVSSEKSPCFDFLYKINIPVF